MVTAVAARAPRARSSGRMPGEPLRVQLVARREARGTGTSRASLDLARALRERGLKVRVAVPPPLPAALLRAVARRGLDAAAFFDSYPVRASLAPCDVVHLTSQTLATLLLCQRMPAPVVVTVHDVIPYLFRRGAELRSFRHPADALFYRLALRGLGRADAVVAVSLDTKRTLVEHVGLPAGRIHVVPLAVRHDVFRPGPVSPEALGRLGLAAGRPTVLYVGSDEPRKNLRVLARAFATVAERVPSAQLVWVGPTLFPEESCAVWRLVAELGLGSCVRRIEGVADADLARLYRTADVLAFPSRYEGFGLPALEAMACGTPVVAADRGALPEVVGDAGLLVAPDDPGELAGALVRVLDDAAFRAHARARGLARAARFTPEAHAAGVARVYAALGVASLG